MEIAQGKVSGRGQTDRPRLGSRLPILGRAGRLALWVLAGILTASLLLVGVLRWVDPPASAFMLLHAYNARRLDRPPPYYHHEWVPWDQLPSVVPLAVIAAEDQRFSGHHGFDMVEIRKALTAYRDGKRLRGASTISQQTAKNLFLWPGRDWLRKGLEAWFTLLIETLWSKQRILEVYLNIVQFSPSTYGVGAASWRYFDRPASALTMGEASLLAGVLPAPGVYRLDRPSARLRQRADWISEQARLLGSWDYLKRL